MEKIEKTVFISYRRTNTPWALAIYQNLTANGFDVFFDYNSIKSGSFEKIIIQNIQGRAHFLVLLTPSALERCNEPNDWLRLEIETALETKRNIIPLFFDGFSFGSPTISKYLTGKLEKLKEYNGMTVPVEYFAAAMERLRNEFLTTPLDTVLHPISDIAKETATHQQLEANNSNKVEQKILTAQEWYEKGNKFIDDENYDEAIFAFNNSLNLDPTSSETHSCRGVSFFLKKDLLSARTDFEKAIQLDPDNEKAHINLGIIFESLGDLDKALKHINISIQKNTKIPNAYYIRAVINNRLNQNFDQSINDSTEAILLKPNYSEAYFSRGVAYSLKHEHAKAISDLNEAIRLNPKVSNYYQARGMTYMKMGKVILGGKDIAKANALKE